ncbi:MAG: TlpA disulfide reductase family protein [Gammaproteobacteria bacterium]|nr:TlpA disulfide reductase family protein [Gammaproteobacteria bacterium]
MNKKDYTVFGFIVMLGVLLGYLWLAPSGQPPAPQASFKDLQGKNFSLEQLRGKPVIVNFWATTCPGCVLEIPALIALSEKYATQNLVVIGVAMDYDPESQVREMVRQKNMTYPVVLDAQGDLAKAFGNVSLIPTTFFINKEGKIYKHKLGEMTHTELETTIQSLIL